MLKSGTYHRFENSWKYLDYRLDFNVFTSRNVLTEKFDFTKSKLIEMTNFFIRDSKGCKLFSNENFKTAIFYIKTYGEKDIIVKKYIQNNVFMLRVDNSKLFYLNRVFWDAFEMKYNVDYVQAKFILQKIVNKLFNLVNYNVVRY